MDVVVGSRAVVVMAKLCLDMMGLANSVMVCLVCKFVMLGYQVFVA